MLRLHMVCRKSFVSNKKYAKQFKVYFKELDDRGRPRGIPRRGTIGKPLDLFDHYRRACTRGQKRAAPKSGSLLGFTCAVWSQTRWPRQSRIRQKSRRPIRCSSFKKEPHDD